MAQVVVPLHAVTKAKAEAYLDGEYTLTPGAIDTQNKIMLVLLHAVAKAAALRASLRPVASRTVQPLDVSRAFCFYIRDAQMRAKAAGYEALVPTPPAKGYDRGLDPVLVAEVGEAMAGAVPASTKIAHAAVNLATAVLETLVKEGLHRCRSELEETEVTKITSRDMLFHCRFMMDLAT